MAIHRPLLELTIIKPAGIRHSSVLSIDELPSLLVELEIAQDKPALDAILETLLKGEVATIPSEPGEIITLSLFTE